VEFTGLYYSYFYLSAAFLVLFYFLRGIKRENRVSSLLFWDNLYKEKNTFSFRLKFRPEPLFFLQILILLLLVTALLQPVIFKAGLLNDRVILVIDQSASMQALDQRKERFAEAVEEAVQRVENYNNNLQIAVVAASERPELLTDFTDNHERIVAILHSLKAQNTEMNLAGTLQIIKALNEQNVHIRTFFYTDAFFNSAQSEFADFYHQYADKFSLVRVGDSIDNYGITAFDVREKSPASGEYELFLKLANFSRQRITAPLVIKVRDSLNKDDKGRELIMDSVSMEPGKVQGRTYTIKLDHLSFVSVDLEVGDPYQLDNSCQAVLGNELQDNYRVLLITEGNFFLEKIISLLPGVSLTVSSNPADAFTEKSFGAFGPHNSTDNVSREGAYDLVIFDRLGPGEDYPGNAIYLGLEPVLPGLKAEKIAQESLVSFWDRTSPLFRFVDLGGLRVKNYQVYSGYQDGKVLLSTPRGAVILAVERPEKKELLLGFDLEQSNLVLQPGFPLLISNIFNWFDPARFDSGSRQIRTAQPYQFTLSKFHLAAAVNTFEVLNPEGESVVVTRGGGAYIVGDTSQKGIYKIVGRDRESSYFSANLLSTQESDQQKPYLIVGINYMEKTGIRRYSFWPYLVLLSLLLLVLEWYIYTGPLFRPFFREIGGGNHEDTA
jgi:Ca-activated chloride channel family protein